MATWTPKTADEIKSEVFNSLRGTPYASDTLDPLSGGAANFIYRATLSKPLEDGTTEVLVKHSEPYMAVAPQNKISIDRCVLLFHVDIENFPLTYIRKWKPNA